MIEYLKAIAEKQAFLNCSNIDENVSHDSFTRILQKAPLWQTLLWKFIILVCKCLDGYLVIDDTIVEKPHSKVDLKKKPFLRWVFSNKHGKSIIGIQVVYILLVTEHFRLPIGFRIYDKSKTKIQLALELLSVCRNTFKLTNQIVLFDSFYAAKQILKRINQYGWIYICRVKRNRHVNGQRIDRWIYHPFKTVVADYYGQRVKMVRNRKHFLICNRVGMSRNQIVNWYKKRAVIEECFKLMKSHCNMKSCQCRSRVAWENHLFFSTLVFLFIEFARKEKRVTFYKMAVTLKFEQLMPYVNLWKQVSGAA